MKILQNSRLRMLSIAFFALFAIGVGSVVTGDSAFAVPVTRTWTGTACNVASSPDCTWSNASNWDTGAPVNGDSVIFTTAVLTAANSGSPVNDIASLSLADLTITGPDANLHPITLTQTLTITDGISDDTHNGTEIDGSIILGANIFVQAFQSLILGDPLASNTIALGGHTLNFSNGSTATNIITINSAITGSGAVNFDTNSTSSVQIHAANTYSGTTHLVTGQVYNTGTNNNMFGTSDVTIDNGASASFNYGANATISNNFAIQGVSSSGRLTSLDFVSTGGSIALAVPNITLNGNTRFSNDTANVTVDLAGITTNSFCIDYIGTSGNASDGAANGFLNAPAGCALPASAPNTAVKFITANPFVIWALGIVTAAFLTVVAIRLRTTSSNK